MPHRELYGLGLTPDAAPLNTVRSILPYIKQNLDMSLPESATLKFAMSLTSIY